VADVLEETWLPPRPAFTSLPGRPVEIARRGPDLNVVRRAAGARPAASASVPRNLAWSVEGPDTDLAKVYAGLSYQLAEVRAGPDRTSTSVTVLQGFANTSRRISAAGGAAFSGYFVRSCEGTLCSDWSEGIRVSHRPPAVSIDGVSASAGSRGAVAQKGVQVSWTEGGDARSVIAYQVAHGTRDARGGLGDLQVAVIPAGRLAARSRADAGERRLTLDGGADGRGQPVVFLRACNDAGCTDWSGATASAAGTRGLSAGRLERSRSPALGAKDLASLENIEPPELTPTSIPRPPASVLRIAPPSP
jgi:hypothetical protein